jgi:cyclophilin family peptidyl-prolyl cis-trans isomerase
MGLSKSITMNLTIEKSFRLDPKVASKAYTDETQDLLLFTSEDGVKFKSEFSLGYPEVDIISLSSEIKGIDLVVTLEMQGTIKNATGYYYNVYIVNSNHEAEDMVLTGDNLPDFYKPPDSKVYHKFKYEGGKGFVQTVTFAESFKLVEKTKMEFSVQVAYLEEIKDLPEDFGIFAVAKVELTPPNEYIFTYDSLGTGGDGSPLPPPEDILYKFTKPDPSDESNTVIVMEVEDYGSIVIELYDSKVPITVNNFLKYVEDEFYDGTIFHRVVSSGLQIIQGGGYLPNMEAKTPTYDPIKLEIDESLTHVDGALAMARTNDPDSATVQFYISIGESNHYLDGEYAVFGRVISGNDLYREINNVDTGYDEQPDEDVIIRKIYVYQPIAPTIIVTYTPSLEDVSDTITISGLAFDMDGDVEKVEIKIDDGSWKPANGSTNWNYELDTTKLSDGEHTIKVRVYDGEFYSDESSIKINVDNDKDTKDDGSSKVDDDKSGALSSKSGKIILVGIILAVVIIIIAFLLLIQKKKNQPAQPKYQPPGEVISQPQQTPTYPSEPYQGYPQVPPQQTPPPPYPPQ